MVEFPAVPHAPGRNAIGSRINCDNHQAVRGFVEGVRCFNPIRCSISVGPEAIAIHGRPVGYCFPPSIRIDSQAVRRVIEKRKVPARFFRVIGKAVDPDGIPKRSLVLSPVSGSVSPRIIRHTVPRPITGAVQDRNPVR